MQSFYTFDFLTTVSQQLMAQLQRTATTILTTGTLSAINSYQAGHNAKQGVYVVYYEGKPVYVGKANNIWERLGEHLEKLSGRQNIDLSSVGYKAVYLDKSMSTAANETLLIDMFQEHHANMWNGAGFGPKDPGKERDTTRPGRFDLDYPIIDTYPVSCPVAADGSIELKYLLKATKAQLPYVFRYGALGAEGERTLVLSGSEKTARDILQEAVTFLGDGWHGAILSYGMVLYKKNKEYAHADVLLPLPANPALSSNFTCGSIDSLVDLID